MGLPKSFLDPLPRSRAARKRRQFQNPSRSSIRRQISRGRGRPFIRVTSRKKSYPGVDPTQDMRQRTSAASRYRATVWKPPRQHHGPLGIPKLRSIPPTATSSIRWGPLLAKQPPPPPPPHPFSGVLPFNLVFSLPTSPLARMSSQTDVESSGPAAIQNDPVGKVQNARRHTLPPHTLLSMQSSPPGQFPGVVQMERSSELRRDGNHSFQGHYARRSFTSNVLGYSYGQPLPFGSPRQRRPSLSGEVPSLHQASLVGSYEESILRGRMSTLPSKPLDFVAQIGVLGLGSCKPQLRCPAHVSVPFPAVFYSYSRTNVESSSVLEEGPSPYVGLIDLENSLAKPDSLEGEIRRKRHCTPASGYGSSQEAKEEGFPPPPMPKLSDNERRLRRNKKKKRRSPSPKAPPGGSYRIPQKGQLQIVIKNPNKTAVKLFLVPYDLEGMEPGTKTFIRQRSYSAGPILEIPLRSRTNDASLERTSDVPSVNGPKDRPTLRYLIHLHICCPSRGRFFLYKSIRVVFANRVPDGKEQLRNEIQLPEPRYSHYKPARESSFGGASHGNTPSSRTDFRRRSSGFGFGSRPGFFDAVDGIGQTTPDGRVPASPLTRIAIRPGSFVPSAPTYQGHVPSRSDHSEWPGSDNELFEPRPGPKDENFHSKEPDNTPLLDFASLGYTHKKSTDQGVLARGDQIERSGPGVGLGNGVPGQPVHDSMELKDGLLTKQLRGLDVERYLDHQRGLR